MNYTIRLIKKQQYAYLIMLIKISKSKSRHILSRKTKDISIFFWDGVVQDHFTMEN